MAARRRLKKQVYFVLVGFVILIVLIVAIILGINTYKDYKYKQTYEYKLLEHGYNDEETAKILSMFSEDEEIDFFLETEKNSNYVLLLDEEYYLSKNFDKYINYINENPDMPLRDIVRNINIHLDNDFYEVTYNTDTSLDTAMLVNKYYRLDNTYNPDDLVVIPQTYSWGDAGSQMVREVAYSAFLDMWNAAAEEGYYLMVSSSYRSYEEQEIVYNNYKNSSGERYADSIAARPGSSEHQTGLTLDIFSRDNSNRATFAGSEVANWIAENSYKYGFILRYPEDKVDITGYSYEAWHFRYVGEDIATYIYEHDITFEEYYAYFLED